MLQRHLEAQGGSFSTRPVFSPPEVRRRDEEGNETAVVAAFDKFIMMCHKLAICAIYCVLFSIFLCMYILFYSVTGRQWFSLLAFH